MKGLSVHLLSLILLVFLPVTSWAQADKVFTTKYTDIHYSSDKNIDDFFWRLGGQRLDFIQDSELASNRVDRIIDRVQMLLNMWPEGFHVAIYLKEGPLASNKAAYYEYKTGSLNISVDYMSDGVLAHELAHAIINQYLPIALPSKVQEILAQYVDKHLWSDY